MRSYDLFPNEEKQKVIFEQMKDSYAFLVAFKSFGPDGDKIFGNTLAMYFDTMLRCAWEEPAVFRLFQAAFPNAMRDYTAAIGVDFAPIKKIVDEAVRTGSTSQSIRNVYETQLTYSQQFNIVTNAYILSNNDRLFGGVQLAGGTAELFVAGGAATTCATLVGCALAGALSTHGIDQMAAGIAAIINNAPSRTLGGQMLQQIGFTPEQAEILYSFAGVGLEIGAIRTMMANPAMITRASLNTYQSTGKLPESVAPNYVPERIVVRTNSAGDSVVSIQGKEMSIHASGQATTRGISNNSIADAMDQQPFQYTQNGGTQYGYYDASTNTFVGVGDRITTVIRPSNPENYLNNLRNRQ